VPFATTVLFLDRDSIDLSRRKQVVEERFDTGVSDEPDWTPRYTSHWDLPGVVFRLSEARHKAYSGLPV
jgi:hypothetical protein